MIQIGAGQAQGSFALHKSNPSPASQGLPALITCGISTGNEHLQILGLLHPLPIKLT